MYLRVDPNNGIPLGMQIANGLRLAILAQRLHPGEQLPSARALAADLRVNFHTVRKAYGDLEAEGVLEFRRGLGTFVTAARQARAAELRRLVRSHLEALVEDLAGVAIDSDALAELVRAELERLTASPEKKT
ncbi:MAG TPA: GntR family transcriptional regulator [Planctomycetota bacterium]|nr:GntR family transcriptional regulator [Planctomycetota bacterium]